MTTLSCAMIVKNENHPGFAVLLRQLGRFCDEVVVCDTGSTDGTPEQAAILGATVVHFPWIDDFAAARNFAFANCKSDWIVWFDADDVLPDETVEIGLRMKAELLSVTPLNVVRVPYEYAYDEAGRPSVVQNRERFVRRSAGITWVGRIHEVLDLGRQDWLNCPEFLVKHKPTSAHTERKIGRNLRVYAEHYDLETMDTRDLYLYAGELRGNKREAEAIPVLKQYLKKWPEDQYDLFQEPYMARIDLLECLRLTGDAIGALRMAGLAIAYDGGRAEAYALAGMVNYDMGYIGAAFPLFLAAAACRAPTHGGVVYMAFYSSAIREMVEDCKAKLEAAPTAR